MTRPDASLDDLPELASGEASEQTRLLIREAVMNDLAPATAATLSTRAGGVVVMALVVMAAGVASTGAHGMQRALGAPMVVGVGALLAATAVMALAFAPRWSSFARGKQLTALMASLLLGWTLLLWQAHAPDTLHAIFTPTAGGCLLRGALCGVVALGGLLWIWRRSDPWTPRLSGALIGTVAGLVAAAGLTMACGSDHAGHLLWGHWLMLPVGAIAGVLLAPYTLRP